MIRKFLKSKERNSLDVNEFCNNSSCKEELKRDNPKDLLSRHSILENQYAGNGRNKILQSYFGPYKVCYILLSVQQNLKRERLCVHSILHCLN